MVALGSLQRVSTNGAAVVTVIYLGSYPGRSPGDSIVIMYKIFQFSRIESVLAPMNLHLFSFLCLPVCLWGLVLCE